MRPRNSREGESEGEIPRCKKRGMEDCGIRRTAAVITLCPVTSDSGSLRKLFIMHAGRPSLRTCEAAAVFTRSTIEVLNARARTRTQEYRQLFVSPPVGARFSFAEKYAPRARFVSGYKTLLFAKRVDGQTAAIVDIPSINKVSEKICVYCRISLRNGLHLDLEIKFVAPKFRFIPVIAHSILLRIQN